MEESVSLITVSYHTGPVLFDMLKAALAQEAVKEIFLVDNGNPLEVLKRLKAMEATEPRLNIIAGQGNVGFAQGNNLGAKQASGDYLLFLNPDSIPEPGFVAALVGQSQKLPHPHILSCRLLDGEGREQSGSRRAILTPMNALVESFSLHKFFPSLEKHRFKWHEEALPKDVQEVPAVSGAVILIPRQDYFAIGGFDDRYFLHAEDIDICLAMARAGGRVYFTPHLALKHIGATSKAPSSFVEWQKAKSFIRYFHKNYSHHYPAPLLWLVDVGILGRFGVGWVISKLGPKSA
jgi:GT2 family glycosyltransferase